MKIDIKHEEIQSGLIFKKTHYAVVLHVIFSEEEKSIIENRGIRRDVVLKRGVPSNRDPSKYQNLPDTFDLEIFMLMDGPDQYALATPLEAKEYEAQLVEALPNLKEYIMANADLSGQGQSFEL